MKPLVEGEIRSCFSMTEVDMPGSNPVMLDTTAVKDGDDYVINGQKWYTSSADGAAFAIVMAVTNPEAPPYMQASMIIVPSEHPRLQPGAQYPGDGSHRQVVCLSHARNSLPALPGAPKQPAGTGRPRFRDRPGTSGAGPNPPLHALDRHLQPRLSI